ncbi:hypothetical protein NUU61_010094 [Penicillium alfredii]|uniref:Uncharacterized protein n=1 Tax=Penicillium alfredii TaxID=1506179 RepID=A0A9W9EHH2_9EURO|nr:uncharacterized protein NUU61_010094 [Penicillium alfredii]KAJ5081830.1 hypothetical protein NUU61_010094 [Penicillium alfredii]
MALSFKKLFNGFRGNRQDRTHESTPSTITPITTAEPIIFPPIVENIRPDSARHTLAVSLKKLAKRFRAITRRGRSATNIVPLAPSKSRPAPLRGILKNPTIANEGNVRSVSSPAEL